MILKNSKVFIVAELSGNHNGNLDIAIESIKGAKRAGADAIKLQTYTPDTMTLNVKNKDFLLTQGTIWDGSYLYDLYKKAYTPWEWHKKLFNVAKNEGIICFSTPFDITSVDFLESIDNPIYKVASFEITDIPLIKYVASKGKPVIISSGIATGDDIKLAIDTIKNEGNNLICLLKCTSSYPSPIEEANLCMIQDFQKKYKVIPGLSDHTMGITSPIVAVTQGAKVIEKHFILDRKIGGPDAAFSMNENEFTNMVNAVRDTEKAMGVIDYSLTNKQIQGKNFSRSLYVSEDVKKGDLVTTKNVRSVRPGYGMHPKHLPNILGKIFTKDCRIGTRVDESLFK